MSNSEMEYNIVGDQGAVETGNLFFNFQVCNYTVYMFLGKCLTSQSANIPSWNKDINKSDKSNDK